MLPEDLDQLLAARRSPQSPQRLEHRQIGFAGAVLLHALPAADAQRVAFADLRQERLHQRRLADSRLAGHEHELPLPVERLLQPLVQPRQLGVSADQRRRPCPATGPAGGCRSVLGRGARAATRTTAVVARSIGPMNRKPRRCTVSMYRGAADVSPSALRRSRMQLASAASLTIASRQTASSAARPS